MLETVYFLVQMPTGVLLDMSLPAVLPADGWLGGLSIMCTLGGIAVTEVLRRRKPVFAERYVVPVSSGLIAGESLMGIAVAMLIVFGVLAQ